MPTEGPSQDDTEASARAKLDDLSARLAAARSEETRNDQAQAASRKSSQSAGIGMRIGFELVAAVLAGAGIGYFLDSRLHTKPIFMLAFIVLGFAAGVLDVLRVIKGLDQAVGLGRAMRDKDTRDAAPGFDDDDDN